MGWPPAEVATSEVHRLVLTALSAGVSLRPPPTAVDNLVDNVVRMLGTVASFATVKTACSFALPC
jgi:hypothetical protein